MGMHCASCAVRIERVLARRPGVRSIEVNFATQHAELTYEPGAFDLGEAGAALDKLGYQIKPVSQEAEAQADAEHGRVQRDWLRRVRLSLPLAAIVVVLVYGFPDRTWARWLALGLTLPVQFGAGWPILSSGLQRARHRSANMDTLIALGTLTAFAYSTVHLLIGGDLFYDTTVVIMAFIVLGRYFECSRNRPRVGCHPRPSRARSQAGPRADRRPRAARPGRSGDRRCDRPRSSRREDPGRRRGA